MFNVYCKCEIILCQSQKNVFSSPKGPLCFLPSLKEGYKLFRDGYSLGMEYPPKEAYPQMAATGRW
jgi:hypothetical protein